MKARIYLLTVVFFLLSSLTSFSQSTLNYQGVIRDGSGQPYSDENVSLRFSILDASLLLVYSEVDALTTNGLGYANTLIGDSDPTAFGLVDWSTGDYSLKVELDRGSDGTYEIDETIALASVPYALYGKDEDADPINELQSLAISGRIITLSDGNSITVPDMMQSLALSSNNLSISGTNSVSLAGYVSPWLKNSSSLYYNTGNIGIGTASPSGKLQVQGESTWSDEEPLFQVKNADGVPVFAVYNNGVQILVEDDPDAKGRPRGGFSVGGFDRASKGYSPTYDFMRISPDSIRFNINNSTGTKGPRGGFAVGGFDRAVKGVIGEDFMHLTPQNALQGLYNTFIGYKAGEDNSSTGNYNSFIGYLAGSNNTTGDYNTFMGYRAGDGNISNSQSIAIGYSAGNKGNYNISIGNSAGANVSGQSNVFLGHQAGISNSTGSNNVFIGHQTGYYNTGGNYNTFLGYKAGLQNTTGGSNVFLGQSSGSANRDGNNNVFLGFEAGRSNLGGDDNIFIGRQSGLYTTEGSRNIFVGYQAGVSNLTGIENVVIGHQAGYYNTTGTDNVFMGFKSGLHNTTAKYNVFLGSGAGSANRTGEGNTYIGFEAGRSNLAGSYNVMIGRYAGLDEMGSNKLYIDNSSTATPLIWGDFTENIVKISGYLMQTSPQAAYDVWIQGGTGGFAGGDNRNLALLGLAENNGDQLVINYGSEYAAGTKVHGNLYYTGSIAHSSDRSLKTNIVPLSGVLEKIKNLNGVYFNFIDTDFFGAQRNIGMIAQDMQLQFPELVSDTGDGLLGINYADFSSVLLEGMKEQQSIIDNQNKRIETLENELSDIKLMLSSILEKQE